jgi:hypothetical protein
MERDGVLLSFQLGKRRSLMIEKSNLTPDEAQQALKSVVKMENAGWRRAVPQRWFGAGIAVLVGSLFAIYALEDPSPYIVFPILALAVFITAAREKGGAYGREVPATKKSLWANVMFAVTMLVVFFGSIYLRRALDAAWVSLVSGLLVGLFIFLASEMERRAYLKKVGQSENK